MWSPSRPTSSCEGVQTPLGVSQRITRSSTMTSENQQDPVFFDSLPYYDNDLEVHSVLREKVQHELAVETQRLEQGKLHPRIPPPLELFSVRTKQSIVRCNTNIPSCQTHPLLALELKRVEARQPLSAIDTTRFQLPAPTSTPGSDEDWKAALDNAHIQLEHQRIR